MSLRLALAAFVLAALPAMATAMCADGEKTMTSVHCGDGQTWDAATQTCVDSTA